MQLIPTATDANFILVKIRPGQRALLHTFALIFSVTSFYDLVQQSSVDKEGKEQLEIEITVDTEALNSKEETERNFLLMSIAYSANIGGTGVVTGSNHR